MKKRTALTQPLEETIESIGKAFVLDGVFVEGREIHAGHINATYEASYRSDEGEVNRYVIQRVNEFVFKDPIAVIQNVEKVTSHISSKVRISTGSSLKLYPTHNGEYYAEDARGGVWRCYNFIEGCCSYDVAQNTHQAYEAARAFGQFQDLLSDLDAMSLVETIPDFHNTPKRFQRLMEVIHEDPIGRLDQVEAEVEFISARKELCSHLVSQQASGYLPLRVTHNDTKLNNVMMDTETDKAVCVIDLDTVMPGLTAYDFGDLVRTATSPVAEDEKDLRLVDMRMEMFEAIAKGYINGCSCLTATEIENLVAGCKVITLEVAIRFLTDFLEGDMYFKVERDQHNLDRARVQIALLKQIEAKEEVMQRTITQCIVA
ncbi:phosphotransferase enzyme family protein [Rubritalea sp.]|uniref:phosphotransferase enzyme family protein n=1 Tax=Rubritalea sp. TaxID=2109375 RepID=UPI003EF2EF40